MNTHAPGVQHEQNDKQRLMFLTIGVMLGVFLLLTVGLLLMTHRAMMIPSEGMDPTLIQRDMVMVNKIAYVVKQPQRGDIVVFDAPPEAAAGQKDLRMVKRIIGAPGDTIRITAPRLTVHGKEIDPAAEASSLRDYLHQHLDVPEKLSLKIGTDRIWIDGNKTVSPEELATRLKVPARDLQMMPGQVFVNGKLLDEPYIKEDPDYDFPETDASFVVSPGTYFVLGDNRNHSADSHYWGTLAKKHIIGKVTQILTPADRARTFP